MWALPAGRDLVGLCAALDVVLETASTPWSLWDVQEPRLIPAGIALWTFEGPRGACARITDDASPAVVRLGLAKPPGEGAWCRSGSSRARIDALAEGQPLRRLLTLPMVHGARADGRIVVQVWRSPVVGLHDIVHAELRVVRPGADAVAWRRVLRRFGATRGRPPIAALVDAVGAWRFGAGPTALDAWAPMARVARAALAPVLRDLARRAANADVDAFHVWQELAGETRAIRWVLRMLNEDPDVDAPLLRRVRRLQDVADTQSEPDPDRAHRAVASWHRKDETGRLKAASSAWLDAETPEGTPAWIEVRRWVHALALEMAAGPSDGLASHRLRRKAARRMVWLTRWFGSLLPPGADDTLARAATAVLADCEAVASHRGHDREEALALRGLADALSLAMGDPSAAWAGGRSTASRC